MRSIYRLAVTLAFTLPLIASAEKSKYADVDAVLNVTALSPGKDALIAVVMDVKEPYHTQSHKPSNPDYIAYEVKVGATDAFTPGTIDYPPGQDMTFAALGSLNVYVGKVVTYVPIHVKADARPGELKITGSAHFQACDESQCFAPKTVKFELAAKVVKAGEVVQPNQPELFVRGKTATTAPATTQPAKKKGAATGWGDWFQKPWFVWPVTAILALMSLGMFGLFTFKLPLGVYTIEPRHDTYLGNFLFGILTAVLSTPCTAPIFPGLLAWAVLQSQSGGRFVGVGVIAMVGVGMALPYLFLSALPELARKLPRTGPWSELVKQMMGFLILAVAAYFAGQRLLPQNEFIWLVFGVIVIAAIFLIVRTGNLMPRPRPIIIALVIAIAMSVGTFALARTLTKPSAVAWIPYSDEALAKTQREGKLAMIDFTAKWCANCQTVEATVFTNPKVLSAINSKNVTTFRADLTNDNAPGSDLVTELNPAGGIPLTAIYSPKRPGKPYVLTSIYRSSTFLGALDAAEKGAPFGETKDMSYLVAFAFALLVGVIFNVMPCVLPVLPLKAIGFYEVSQHNRAKAFSYGVVFSLGIVATFCVLAVLVLPVAR